jgi:large subunit ribosomal protein L24
MRIIKGDTVVVISGKDAGKKGKVLQAQPKKERIIVEGVNMVTKHQKASQQVRQAGIIHQEAAIHVSNVMLLDPKLKTGTRVSYKVLDNGKKVRVAVKSGEVID